MPARIERSALQIQFALMRSGGLVSLAARRLRMSPRSLQRRLAAEPHLALSREEFDDLMTDYAYAQMLKELGQGNLRVAKWLLVRLGGRRGFGVRRERIEVHWDIDSILKDFKADQLR